jgi:hypothetical protein
MSLILQALLDKVPGVLTVELEDYVTDLESGGAGRG